MPPCGRPGGYAGKDIWLQQPSPTHDRGVPEFCEPFVAMHWENVAAIAAASKQPRGPLSGWNSQAAMCGKPAATANRHLHRICVCMHQPAANASVDRLKQGVRPLHSDVSVCMYDRLEQPDRIHEQIYDIFATTSRGVSNNHVVNTT